MTTIKIEWTVVKSVEALEDVKQVLSQGGIYLWIARGNPNRVSYVGEATQFRNRFVSHMAALQGGSYAAFDYDRSKDYLQFLFDHVVGKNHGPDHPVKNVFYPMLPHKVNFKYLTSSQAQRIRAQYLQNLSFAFGILDNVKVRKVAESILQLELARFYQSLDPLKRPFVAPGGRSNNTLVGAVIRTPDDGSYLLEHHGDVSAVPREVISVTRYSGFKNVA